MALATKTAGEFLLGDIFVFVHSQKRCHFRIMNIKGDEVAGYDMKAELLWVSDGDYFSHDIGYTEWFTFGPKWLAHRHEIKKTSKNGCCKKCLGELEWVVMALKCSQCGIVY